MSNIDEQFDKELTGLQDAIEATIDFHILNSVHLDRDDAQQVLLWMLEDWHDDE